MAITVGGTTFPDPNSFNEQQVVTGDYTKTLNGYTRRAIRSVKRIWTIGWGTLSQTLYDDIKAQYDDNTTKTFVYDTVAPAISATVYLDLSTRQYISGTGEYLSSIELTLTEV